MKTTGENSSAGSVIELFAVTEMTSLSPRLRWMKRHGIRTKFRTDLSSDEPKWEAYVGNYRQSLRRTLDGDGFDGYPFESPFLAWDETEETALRQLAKNRGMETWEVDG